MMKSSKLGDGTPAGPLDIIRTETALSRFPVHHLSRAGAHRIEITRRDERGQVRLRWEVSYNQRYGWPGPLAYKLDTLLVNRRIEEAGAPPPPLVRLGTLNEMCRELGSHKEELKRALRQNATAAINAKIDYRASDGAERHLEALFTRYDVIFTGERLPGGGRADAVYLSLGETYREVLGSARRRPLDYDYLKGLAPTAQRCYEIISYKIYAALAHRLDRARITYSEYCLYSTQQRYQDYDRVKKQMYKVHSPHLKSGYLAKVEFQQRRAEGGEPDWMICYTPGPKARTEYAAFAGREVTGHAECHSDPEDSSGVVTSNTESADGGAPEAPGRAGTGTSPDPLLDELVRRGITRERAGKLLTPASRCERVPRLLAWGDHLMANAPAGTYHNPPGFFIHLIESGAEVPEDFVTKTVTKSVPGEWHPPECPGCYGAGMEIVPGKGARRCTVGPEVRSPSHSHDSRSKSVVAPR